MANANANAIRSAANPELDLALRLGPPLALQLLPPHHAPGLDLHLGPPGSDAGRARGRDLDMERVAARSEVLVEGVGDGAGSGSVVSPDQMAPDLSSEVVHVDAAEHHESTGSNNDHPAPAPDPVQVEQQPLIPLAGRGARRPRRMWADLNFGSVPAMNPGDTVPAWVRRELLPIYNLPEDHPLHYIGYKVLCKTDPRTRFLFSARLVDQIRELLTGDEIASAGFHIDYTQIDRSSAQRASPTRNPGVAVSVYTSSGKWSNFNLTKFPRSNGTVINGTGYRSFMASCGMVAGIGVELWAFRRSPNHRLCFVMARTD